MKIAIDLNDVVREYSSNYVKYYKKGLNPSFDESDVEFFTNDMSILLPFKSDEEWRRFTYEDYPFELYSKCPSVESNIPRDLNRWITDDLHGEDVEVAFISPMEYGLTIQCSYSFLAKIGSRVREVYFPSDSTTVWDRYDVVISANPRILNSAKEGKKSIKINKEYNKDVKSDMDFDSLLDIINNNENTEKILRNE